MTDQIDAIVKEIQRLEIELENALGPRAKELRDSLSPLQAEFLRQQDALRIGVWKYLRTSNPLSIITAPIIYSLIIPFALSDLFVTAYQYVCFPIYGLKRVRRSDFFIFDRRHLAYLNIIEKFNCTYCSYINGLIAYVREVASLTEAHWCPIKHANHLRHTHKRYQDFAAYGDPQAFRKVSDKKED